MGRPWKKEWSASVLLSRKRFAHSMRNTCADLRPDVDSAVRQHAGVYYIAVKFQTSNVGGDPAPASGTTVRHDFSATGVPGSTSSVDLVKQ